MSLIEDELERLAERDVAVIMTDGKKFRGKLIRFDSKTMVLEDVLELSDRQHWVKPIIYTSVEESITEQQNTIDQAERGYLDEVIINTRHIIRIWPWEPKRIERAL